MVRKLYGVVRRRWPTYSERSLEVMVRKSMSNQVRVMLMTRKNAQMRQLFLSKRKNCQRVLLWNFR
jgi:hypothetical protein